MPAWVTQALGIAKIDELDIQLISQKKPVFLLNESPSVRAQLLSVGRESGRLHELIEDYGNLKRRDSEQARDGEAECMKLRFAIGASAVLPTLPPVLERLTRTGQELDQHKTRAEQMSRLLARVDAILARRDQFARAAAALQDLPEVLPTVSDTRPLAKVIQTIEQSAPKAALASECERIKSLAEQAPMMSDTRSLARLIRLLETTARKA